jgi:cytoskeletal protein CcmA (bactofilin family)
MPSDVHLVEQRMDEAAADNAEELSEISIYDDAGMEGLSMAVDPEKISSPRISRITRIQGNIEFRGFAKIEGAAEGEITGDYIEITPSAVVTARITANNLEVAGQVEGDIVAHERIELLPTARLRCTITTPKLVIAEGAQFEGDCKMYPPATSSQQSESQEMKNSGVSSFITQPARASLRDFGSDNDIFRMEPADPQPRLTSSEQPPGGESLE